MEFQTILYEKKNAVVRLTLNRPKELNAINMQLSDDLHEALLACEKDAEVRAVVLTGSGRAFCAGGDVGNFRAHLTTAPKFLKRLTISFHTAVAQMTRMPKPVVAVVNGVCAGGGMGFVAAADLVLAAQSAKFNMAYTAIAATPDGGTTFFLPRLIGLRRAMELTLLSRPFTAEEALSWGLINKVVPDDQLAQETDALAEKLAAGPTLAYGAAKRLLIEAMTTPLETQMESESRAMSAAGATADFAEGVTAFLDKRKANFTGK